MTDSARPLITGTRETMKAAVVRSISGEFDADVWHVLNREDDALIAEEVLNGSLSGAFVYNFQIKGEDVQGVSVLGANQLARRYGGLKHRVVGSIEKRGGLFIAKAYAGEGVPMQVNAQYIRELEDEPDYYQALVEVTDIKTGNSVQVERTELRHEKRRDGTPYERPNFQTIAQSKARRNAILDVVPQDVVLEFKRECLKLGKSKDVTASVIDEARANVLTFAARQGIGLSRESVFDLGLAEISGLREAAKAGAAAFRQAATGMGLFGAQVAIEQQQAAPQAAPAAEPAQAPAPAKTRQAKRQAPEPEPEPETGPLYDPATGEVDEPEPAPAKRGKLFGEEG